MPEWNGVSGNIKTFVQQSRKEDLVKLLAAIDDVISREQKIMYDCPREEGEIHLHISTAFSNLRTNLLKSHLPAETKLALE